MPGPGCTGYTHEAGSVGISLQPEVPARACLREHQLVPSPHQPQDNEVTQRSSKVCDGWSISLFRLPQKSFSLKLGLPWLPSVCLTLWRKLVFLEKHENDSESTQDRRWSDSTFSFCCLNSNCFQNSASLLSLKLSCSIISGTLHAQNKRKQNTKTSFESKLVCEGILF